jgi:hypothetical protein
MSCWSATLWMNDWDGGLVTLQPFWPGNT